MPQWDNQDVGWAVFLLEALRDDPFSYLFQFLEAILVQGFFLLLLGFIYFYYCSDFLLQTWKIVIYPFLPVQLVGISLFIVYSYTLFFKSLCRWLLLLYFHFWFHLFFGPSLFSTSSLPSHYSCLLYTSDAADDWLVV